MGMAAASHSQYHFSHRPFTSIIVHCQACFGFPYALAQLIPHCFHVVFKWQYVAGRACIQLKSYLVFLINRTGGKYRMGGHHFTELMKNTSSSSLQLSSRQWTFVVDLHTLEKWPFLPHLRHSLSNAGYASFLNSCL